MNAHNSASKSQKVGHASPFEQITALELEQEKRLAQALETQADEEREAAKTLAATLEFQDAKLREDAKEELREFSKSESASILKKNEDETANDLRLIEESYRKNAPKIVTELATSVIEYSSLTSR